MMIDKAVSAIRRYEMIPPGSRVIAAVSGGSDSMAMLALLRELRTEFGFELEAAHVNHCLRGEAADRDEDFVRRICGEWDIPFHLLRADVACEAKKNGMSLEEAGRKVRYDFFASFGEDVIIATAHNLSDRTETFLFNFARGASLRGLCSIPPVRGNIIRPLINCSKAEIVSFCESRNIGYVTDESNSDVKYSRNRIRHNVITELKAVNPAFEECASRCMESLNEDEKFLSSLASELVKRASGENGIGAAVIAGAPLPLRNRAIVKIIEAEAGITPDSESVNRVSGILGGGACEINGGVRVRVRRGLLEFPCEYDAPEGETEISEGVYEFGGFTVETKLISAADTKNLQKLSGEVLEYYLDYDKIVGKMKLRGRAPGDKIKLFPSDCTKTLKKLFNEKAVPPEKRGLIPLIADDEGVILVPGFGFDAGVRVTGETERILSVKIKDQG